MSLYEDFSRWNKGEGGGDEFDPLPENDLSETEEVVDEEGISSADEAWIEWHEALDESQDWGPDDARFVPKQDEV